MTDDQTAERGELIRWCPATAEAPRMPGDEPGLSLGCTQRHGHHPPHTWATRTPED